MVIGSELTSVIQEANGAPKNLQAALAEPGAISVAYDASTQTYTVNEKVLEGQIAVPGMQPTNSATFTEADADGSAGAQSATYRTADGTRSDVLAVYRPGAATQVQLTYVTFGIWTTKVDNGDTSSFAARSFAGGVLTPAGEMPRTGTATYQGSVDGLYADSSRMLRLGGTGSMKVDFASGDIASLLNLTGSDAAGGVQALGSVAGLGTISSSPHLGGAVTGENQYAGDYTGAGGLSGVNGSFIGAFFGPEAAETAHSFELTGPNSTAVTGVFGGKKD